MTFSVAARCAHTGMLGVVVSSSSPAVAARCAYVRAGVGAACSQNITDPTLGPALLDALDDGLDAPAALDRVVAGAAHADFRQLTVIGADGDGAAYSGRQVLGRHSSARGEGIVAAGNLLASDRVPAAMVEAFTAVPDQHLGDRLLAALHAAVDAGGEEGPVRSCGMLIVDTVSWPVTDLRVDWSDDPIGDLARVWQVWKPQADDYVTRALHPDGAPSYGVPGDN
ncbi:DUF1028 domain-containing protein [Leekyejoonella antrihumi]|uniref:DUF1028 domain-containing protein n=1 Tax=Leekyejoonella antrihumi TaxID=1660198 RepID=A0A563DY85_9MICO|nr:DUF1028 domain-containing protein [Leekyejoonella antrihumi]TWP34932.1 DUF1028 domain-containing protein [Leekyejoonella antrihumi]